MKSEPMHAAFVPQVLTANSLRSGHVVFLDRNGGWAPRLCDAAVARDEAAVQALMDLLQRAAAQAVEPYLLAVLEQADGSWQPVGMRERRRVQGPSVGPQASTHGACALVT